MLEVGVQEVLAAVIHGSGYYDTVTTGVYRDTGPVWVVRARGAGLHISRRDQEIVELAVRKLRGTSFGFGAALRALREATEEVIPDGRVYYLGAIGGPVFGSIISGLGIVESATGIDLVRVRGAEVHMLGSLGS